MLMCSAPFEEEALVQQYCIRGSVSNHVDFKLCGLQEWIFRYIHHVRESPMVPVPKGACYYLSN